MISAKELTEEQRTAIAEWAREGAQLAEIQKRLVEDFKLNATYMDTRFLILDLGIELMSEEGGEESPEPAEIGDAAPEPTPEPAEPSPLDPDVAPPAGGQVTVTTDQLTRPGTVVSGTVVFSDGVMAKWYLDQMGRLGLDPDSPGYQPAEADLVAFESELRRLLG